MADSERHSFDKRIVILTAGGPLAEVVVNAVAKRFDKVSVIQEDAETIVEMARRWCRLHGVRTALGRLAFGPLQRIAAWRSRHRRREILDGHGLDPVIREDVERHRVHSVNSDDCRQHLVALLPRAVLVVGTRMIRRQTLEAVDAPFINYHAGLNPMYRGQYGGYWAAATGNRDQVGVTVHLIDQGVDTGAILYVETLELTAHDSMATIHYRQVAAAVPLILQSLHDAIDCSLKPQTTTGASTQWFHPTAVAYVANGLRLGLW